MMNEAAMGLDRHTTPSRITPEMIEEFILAETCFSAWEGLVGAQDAGFEGGTARAGEMVTTGGEHWTDPLRLLTICVLVLRNGFTVHGVSSVVDPSKYDREIGMRVARENALNAVWPLMGFALKNRLTGSDGMTR